MEKLIHFKIFKTFNGIALVFRIKGRGLKVILSKTKLYSLDKFAWINSIEYDFGAICFYVYKGRPVTHLERVAINHRG